MEYLFLFHPIQILGANYNPSLFTFFHNLRDWNDRQTTGLTSFASNHLQVEMIAFR